MDWKSVLELMLSVSSTSHRLKTTKGTLVLVGFIFVFIVASVAIGFRASNAFVPAAKGGCHGGNDEGAFTCTTSDTSTDTTTVTVVSTSTDQSTSAGGNGNIQNSVIVPSPSTCNALNGISYQVLSAGTQLQIAFNGNGQMSFVVPSQSFAWNWYWIPLAGQDANSLGQQLTNTMWASGHGQNFSFFIASLNGQAGIVLQTDYALSQACG
jgi:hypothetical protein